MMTLTVGGLPVEYDQAVAWATAYLRGRGASAYPAYDAYEGSGHGKLELGDADLLAPALLNASQNPVPTYYTLQALAPALNEALREVPSDVVLEHASEAQLDAVGALFGVLDGRTPYVKMTTLAKVLARKRPGLIPLFDAAIGHCYTDCPGAPVPEEKGRSVQGYARAWLGAVRDDLVRHLQQWSDLAALAPEDQVQIRPLRALDIVAWEAGKRAMAAQPPKPGRGRRAAPVDPV